MNAVRSQPMELAFKKKTQNIGIALIKKAVLTGNCCKETTIQKNHQPKREAVTLARGKPPTIRGESSQAA